MGSGIQDDRSDGFAEYRKLLIHELNRLDRRGDRLEGKIDTMRQTFEEKLEEIVSDLVMLKTKAALWGAGAGVVVGGMASTIVGLLLQR